MAGRGHRVCEAQSVHCVGVWHSFRRSRQRDSEGEKETGKGQKAKAEAENQAFQLPFPPEISSLSFWEGVMRHSKSDALVSVEQMD